MKPTIKFIQAAFALFAFACFALLPQVGAAPDVSPPTDGCYPGFTTAEGCNALTAITSGAGNTGVGWRSLFSLTTGSYNTAVGAGTLVLNTSSSNTAVGTAALLLNTSGTQDTANGTGALVYNDSGSYDTAVGAFALFSNISANSNTAIGSYALFSNVIGDANTAIGAGALQNNSADSNTAIGDGALLSNTTGTQNTAVGVQALLVKTSGNNNIALGNQAGLNLSNGDNNIDIGNQGVDGESNTIRIGDPAIQTGTYIAGVFGAAPGPDALPVGIDTNGQLGTIPSSPSTQAVVTGSRALNTIFQNTGSTPRFVSLTCTMGNGSSEGTMKALTDANNPPTTELAHVASGAVSSVGERDALQLFFIVLPGNYYRVTTVGTVILGIWTEWQ